MSIKYMRGDATRPSKKGNKIIIHICNDIGAWGAGFVLAVSRRWPKPKAEYLKAVRNGELKLGDIQMVKVEEDTWVANMIAQRDIVTRNRLPPIRYNALGKCLAKVAQEAERIKASVHMPRIGCGLAGGKWELVEPLIVTHLGKVENFVYDLP